MPLQTQIDSHKVVEGWLWKKGVYNTSWKRRWFVLYDDRTCSYFEKEKHSKSRSKAKGTIHLSQINRVEFVQYDDGKDNNSTPHRPSNENNPTAFSFQHDPQSPAESNHYLMLPKQSVSMSRSIHSNSGSEDPSLYPFRTGLQSISEKEESCILDSAHSRSNRQLISTGPAAHRQHAHGVNGWSMDVTDWSGQNTIVSSVQPPPEYTAIEETEQQFEKERADLAKSLEELRKNSASPRPPTPKVQQGRLERSQSSGELLLSSARSAPPSQLNESAIMPMTARLMRSQSAGSVTSFGRRRTKQNKYDIRPRQSFIHPALAECVLSDEDANEFMNKSIISSKIKKFHEDRRKSTAVSASSASTASIDSFQTECCITPRDELHAFQRIMNDTKLGLKSNRRYSFALISKDRDFILSAESNQDLKEWIVAFNKLCQGKPVLDGHFVNHGEKFFVLHRNKVLNTYKSRKSMQIDTDYDLRNVHYLKFDADQNEIKLVMPSYNKKENNTLTLRAGCASKASEWYYALLATIRKHNKVELRYQTAVEHIHIVHNGVQLENRYVAIYKDYMVIFKNKQQLDSLASMTFFDKKTFRDYIRKEHCTIIPLNEASVVRKASRSHGKYAFLVANDASCERRWYFSVSRKQILTECLRFLRNNKQNPPKRETKNILPSEPTTPFPVDEHQKDQLVEVDMYDLDEDQDGDTKDDMLEVDMDPDDEHDDEEEEPVCSLNSIPIFKQMAVDQHDKDDVVDEEEVSIVLPVTLKLAIKTSDTGCRTTQLTPIPLLNDFHSGLSTISNDSVCSNMSILSEASCISQTEAAYGSIHV